MKLFNFKLRYQILLVMMPLAILPVIAIIVITSFQIASYLKKQNLFLYQSVLEQINNKIDFIYNQYGMTFDDIISTDNFLNLVNAKEFQSKIEETAFIKEALGERAIEIKGFTIRKIAFTRIDGEFSVIELDRKSLLTDEKYKIWQITQLITNKNIEKMISDPLFLYMKENNKKLIFGKLGNGVLSGFEAEKKNVFIYPYYKDDTNEFNEFLLVTVEKNFINKIYEEIMPIKYGTLFILDPINNIIASNHPSENDYYQYDETKRKYTLEDDNPNDPDENMSFREYSMLTTDPQILNTPEIKIILENLGKNDFDMSKIKNRQIRFNGKNYIFSISHSNKSEIKLIYFHPVGQITKPIYQVISIILIFAIILIILIVLISAFFSRTITNPVKQLGDASQTISDGNYKVEINTNNYSGELLELGNSFNKMTKEINDYREHLEDLVKSRTIKLSEANKKMKDDLMMAQRIQESLIPRVFPKSDSLKMSGLYIPMENLGGDLYDVIKLSETKIALLILDVCGHGVAAALITTMAKALFNSYSIKGLSCKEVIEKVNKELYNIIGDLGNYLTAFYGIIDLNNQTMEYTNAAHTISYILKEDGSITELDTNSTMIGIFDNVDFESNTIILDKNDKIILYTDGIPESRDIDNNLYGYERFKLLLRKYKNLSSKDFVKIIIDEVKEYRKDQPQEDDITLLIVEILPDVSKKIKVNIEILNDLLYFDTEEIEDERLKENANLFMKAVSIFKDEEYNEVIEILESVKGSFNRKSDNFKIQLLLGFTYYKIDNFKKAKEVWQKGLEYNPENKDIKSYLVMLEEIETN